MPFLDDWMAALDEEAAFLETSRAPLQALARLGREAGGRRLEDLVAEMQALEIAHADTERRQQKARRALARALGWALHETTLGRVAEELPPDEREPVLDRRRRLARLAGEVRRESRAATAFLLECGRANRRLLQGILPGARSLTTYGPRGQAPWRPEHGLFDMRR
jgi:hypothetical protein